MIEFFIGRDNLWWVLFTVSAVFSILVLRGLYIWFFRISKRTPKTSAEWSGDCAKLCTATIDGSKISFKNVRDFTWRTTKDRDENWIDEVTVDASDVADVWFIVDHFHSIKALAHTYLTIEFKDGTNLSFSFEARRQKGVRYHPWDGLWRSYELYLLVGTERDITGLRTNARGNTDYMFRAVTADGKDQMLLMLLAHRLNELASSPEWYHSLFTACNTSIVKVVNRVTPGRVPFLWRNFFPGHTPRAAHRLGLIEDWGGYEQTLAKARIDRIAQDLDVKEGFSEGLREHLP